MSEGLLQESGLQGKTAVVTGSTGGIGRAIALQLAAAGANVVVHGRRQQAAEETAAEILARGAQTHVLLGDLADAGLHESLVQQAWQWQQGVDIWVNNAGLDVLTGPAAQWSFEEKLQQLWRVDVTATIHLSRRVGRRMRERASSEAPAVILNMGWDQAELGMGGDSGEMFAATKGAIMAFSRSLARSLAPNVRVNCLAPGWIRTQWGEGASEYWQQRARREALRERWGTPEDVARVACFLASPAADFLTGHVLPVNGGFRGAE